MILLRKVNASYQVEAMKVMNEVPAPKDGVITEILVANEEVVDYGKDWYARQLILRIREAYHTVGPMLLPTVLEVSIQITAIKNVTINEPL